MTKKIIFHKKDFLNMDGHLSDASIFSNVIRHKATAEDNTAEYRSHDYWSTELKIRDCEKSVYIDLELDDLNQVANTVYKLTVLINHISELRDAILKIKIDEQK